MCKKAVSIPAIKTSIKQEPFFKIYSPSEKSARLSALAKCVKYLHSEENFVPGIISQVSNWKISILQISKNMTSASGKT